MSKDSPSKATKQGKKQGVGRGGVEPPKEYRFKPGQSGNPGGRPHKKPITELYEKILSNPENMKALEQAIIKTITSRGMAQVLTMKEMAERVEGKVTQPIEANVNVSLADAIAEARKRAAK